MGKKLFFFAVLFSTATAFAQLAESKPEGPVLAWEKSNFDFGELAQGDKIEHTFRFTNTGTQPLIITNVTTPCGCTTPKGWPKDPVMPGEKGEITLSFNSAGKYGRQNKVASIISNALNTAEAQLLLSGNVTAKKSQ